MFDDLSVVPARPEHVYRIIKTLRQKDKDFIWTFAGCRPYEFLTRAFTMSPISFSCLKKKEPLCVFGVASSDIMSKSGTFWLAACDEVARFSPGAVVLGGRKYFNVFKKHFESIEYFVEPSNRDGLRKLSKIGFKSTGEVLSGKHGKAFRRMCYHGSEIQNFLFSRNISKTSSAHS